DVHVHLSFTAYVADAAAIQAAPDRFKLFDDLHGTNLRGAGDGAAGEGAGEQAEGVLIRGEGAGDAADQMVYVGVAFDAEQFGHSDAAEGAAAAEVIAQQVDDHQVFCSI